MPRRLQLFVVLVILGCFPFILCKKSTPNSQQLDEIAKLRSELNKALEASEDEGPEGVVVQPGWTRNKSPPASQTFKVVVNKENLKTAAEWREKIQEAVATQGQTKEVIELEAHLKAQSSATSDTNVGAVQEEMLGGSLQATPDSKDQPNYVDSSRFDMEIDLEKLQMLELSKRRTREMLILKGIEENFNVSLDLGILQYLQLRLNGSNYILGRRTNDMLIYREDFSVLQIMQLPPSINVMETFDRFLVISSEKSIIWLRLEEEVGLTSFWHWPMGYKINKFRLFSVDKAIFLISSHTQTVDIFNIDLETQEFGIIQHMQMQKDITAIALLDTGRDFAFAVGHSDEVLIYLHNLGHEFLNFRFSERIEAENLADVTSFQMGGRSYLALGGTRPQIIYYNQGKFLPRTILGQNFGLVEFYLPLPIRSYRDDLLLLIQHRVNFDTHFLVVIDLVIWNGEAFEASLPSPCQVMNHISYGLQCLIDERRDEGLRGSLYMGQHLLLIPRQPPAPTGVFRLQTELLSRNSEMHDLQDIYDFMQHWVKEEDELLELGKQILMPSAGNAETFEEIFAPEVINNNAQIVEILVNDMPWSPKEDDKMNLLHLLEDIKQLEREVGQQLKRGKRQIPIDLFQFHYEFLDFDAVEVGELFLEKLNQKYFFIQNATLKFPQGSLTVENLELLEITKGKEIEQQESLELPDYLEFEFINGHDWAKFVGHDVIWRDQPLKLDELEVEGPIVFEDSLHLSLLNELNFPQDYLWSQSNSSTIIRAPKEFTKTLSVNSLDTTGTINGINPLDAITLSDNQDWPGKITFNQLEVSEEMEVKGRAQSNDEIPLNPTLRESRKIDSACHFNNLIVQGPLYLKGSWDDENFDALLGDLVQHKTDPNGEIAIPSFKQVGQLDLPIDSHVDDGKLGQILLENFITKNTNQILRNLTELRAHVYIHQLQLLNDKTYDGVQLEQLMNEGIPLDRPVDSSELKLNFSTNPEFSDLKVISKLNNQFLTKDYQTLYEGLYLEWAKLGNVKVNQADVNSDIMGKGLLNGYHDSNDIYVQELILPQGLQTAQLQGVPAHFLLNFLNQPLDELPLLVLHGQLKVEKILVSGDIQISAKLNNLNWSQLEREVIWLSRPNELKTRWLCREQPIFAKNLNIHGSYNEILLPEILHDVIFQPTNQEEEIVIKGPKSFASPTKVLNELQIEALNGISFDHLAKTKKPLNITGSVYIEGDLCVLDINLKGNLNHENPQELDKILAWNNTFNSFILIGTLQFPRVATDELTVLGHFGNQSYLPLGRFFDQLLYRNQDNIRLEKHQIFTGRVDLIGGAKISEINHFPIAKLLNDMIFLDGGGDQEIILNTSVIFKAAVQTDKLHAERLILRGQLLNGCNVSDWLRDTIRVDRDWQSNFPLTFSTGSLDNNALRVNQMNDLDLTKVITLRRAQILSEHLVIEDLYLDGEIKVKGLVNERHLREEYDNTLMSNSPYEQHVETPLILPLLHVSNSLETLTVVNGNSNLNLSNVAVLSKEVLHIQSPLYLGRLHIPDLKSQLINAFNFTTWHENSLWSQGRPQQIISGNWRVKELRIKQTPHLLYRRQAIKLCSQFNQMFDLLNLPYQLKSLRHSFSLKQSKNQSSIRRVFALEKSKQKENYLMINELGCWTRIYKWNGTRFQHNGAFQSGPIDDVKVIESKDEQFTFMTSYELDDEEHETNWNCSGINRLQSWRTENEMELEPYDLPMETMEDLRNRYEEPKYQQTFRYLQRPKVDINLRSRDEDKNDKTEDCARLHQRLLKNLNFRLETEINITQLMIPESDLYDNYLIEDFLRLMHDLEGYHKELPTETLHLPDTPARVLAARCSQLILNVQQELHKTFQGCEERATEVMLLNQTLVDVLLMANTNNSSDSSQQLHDVIQRIRQLQHELKVDDGDISTSASTRREIHQLSSINAYWRPIQTIRMHVGSSQRPRLLYARLTLLSAESMPPATPSTAPPAHIQLHYSNGSLFQSLAADHQTRQLCALRIKDETLLAFVNGCCHIRVFIYRGVQGFVLFSQFKARGATINSPVLQLMALRLPLQKSPGAQYVFAVIQSRNVTFYEVVIAGLLEPWLQCK